MRAYGPVNLQPLLFLIVLNVTLFVITIVVGGYPITGDNDLVRLFGLTAYGLSEQPWTIMSNMFIHGGLGHIAFNMISLYFLGSLLIRAVGERGFLALFFLGGLAGNILYAVLGHLVLQGVLPPAFGNPYIPGIGASGGIFALAGALAVMVPRAPVLIFFIPVPMPLWVAVLILLGISFLISGIAWQAHLGGLLLGLAAGLIFRKRRRLHYF